MVFHHVLGGVNFEGTTLKRPLEISGQEVTHQVSADRQRPGPADEHLGDAAQAEWRRRHAAGRAAVANAPS
jgi:hypothetical protein